MNLMRPESSLAKLSFLCLSIILIFSVNLTAQSRGKKAALVKKNEKRAKDARKDFRKDNKKERLAKRDTKGDYRRQKTAANSKNARRDERKERQTAKAKAKEKEKGRNRAEKDARGPKDRKKLAELRRLEAERRAAEEARRQAALAEQRRREQAAREARQRKLAFERGLRNETAENIANDVTDSEDLGVRSAAVNALGDRAGTVVVMEAQTGKVLTIVNQNWAIRNSFKPCSTIKLVTGVAGLNERVINENGQIGGSGLELQDALARSNNGYFQRVGSNLGSRKMVEYAHKLGLGERTGINADGETAGRVPDGNDSARIYSHGDDFEVTPLQLAVMASALANGGKMVVPQIPSQRYERSSFRPLIKDRVGLPVSSIEGVLPGMVGAAEYGTARRGVDARMGVAGKTGSCIYKGSWIGLFTSVAPVEDPKYSVVVITRGERERGKYAAAVAGKIYQALGSRIRRNPDRDLARRNLLPIPSNPRLASRDEDEEDADSPENTQGDEQPIIVGQRNAVVATQPPPEPKKLIQKITQSRPTNFPPVVITFDRNADREPALKERPRIVKNK